ncbi:PKD domain-containing protein [Acanthopleuribacter pedis]|uniref:M4 family metallopeptidase n=1 Tax=Acanthopleuribacter pedis TaxID=442870 RepID=A0A8J7QLW0_9BACT|nr:M4 family metallopeptidase [Acanthopleuribacter pedis]MBO1322085.1 M4 family metallopeptidase [Acanthopleuribacter pedis]
MNQFQWSRLALILGCLLLPMMVVAQDTQTARSARDLGFSRVSLDQSGSPRFLGGQTNLIVRDSKDAEGLFQGKLAKIYQLGKADAVRFVSMEKFNGTRTYRMQQTFQGLEVRGGDLVIQIGADGQVLAVSGRVINNINVNVRPVHFFNGLYENAISDLLGIDGIAAGAIPYNVLKPADLVIYAHPEGGVHLAFETDVEFAHDDHFYMERMMIDAETQGLIGSETLIHSALDRRVHTANNGCFAPIFGTSLPGRQVISEGGASDDYVAQGAYDNTGTTYWFFYHMFGRDSYDGRGIPLVSTVHITFATGLFPSNCSPNNAAFLQAPYNQMLYGDGDGEILRETALSLDVTAHELAHGFTNSTSRLVYQRESGAINEAMSDIFGAGAEAWKMSLDAEGKRPEDGNPANYQTFRETWLLGDDIAGSQLGEALRYMNNPTLDGRSPDFYPERNYPNNCSPGAGNDNCGVHTNSGIANLAFFLLVEGGTHPQGKTTVNVPGIGMIDALNIFYETNAQLLSQNATFEDLRFASAQAAANQFGENSCQFSAVMKAWDAVGVNGSWNDPGGTCGGPVNEAPTASFSFTTDELSAAFDGSASTDSDGSIASYAWDFGDGNQGSGVSAAHTYRSEGTYRVVLVVTDNQGATGRAEADVTVSETDIIPPTAAFTFSADRLNVSFDGSASSGPNGAITDYAWDLGDGSSASGAQVNHRYGAAGSYSVTLTVTDAAGLQGSTSQTVTVDDPGDDCGNGFQIGSSVVTFNNNGRSIQTDLYYPSASGGSNADMIEGCGFPVVVFGHGFTIGTNAYDYLFEGLVPAGYIVAMPRTESGFSPSHGRFGSDIAFLASEIIRAYPNSTSGTSAVSGHSMGGGSAFLAMAENPSITALFSLAAAETNPSAIEAAASIDRPSLVIAASRDCVTPAEDHQTPMFEALAAADKEFVMLDGASHCQFTTGNFNCSFGEFFCGQRPSLSEAEQHAQTLATILPWLDRVLR